jgi:hypothetical protein
MPLLSKLHPWMPDDGVRHSLGVAWVCSLVGWLNRELPRKDYRADPDVQSEVKVLEELRPRPAPPATITTQAIVPDRCHVVVQERWNVLRPSGVIALVTPRTKEDAQKRTVFVSRCLGILSNTTGLVVIDTIPGPAPTPCAELATALGITATIPQFAALSFRTALRGENTELDFWVKELVIGEPLPAMPLGLRGGPVVLLDLEGTYTGALQVLGL